MGNNDQKISFLKSAPKEQLSTVLHNDMPLENKSYLEDNRAVNPTCITEDDYKLIEDINNAKNEWLEANSNLQYVSEHEIIDYYIYILKAAQIKYDYYLKKAKEKGLLADPVHKA